MSQNEPETLTEDGLLAELHRLRYADMTKRRLGLWRETDLLPPFDLIGGGRGRGVGRAKSAWLHPKRIVERAAYAYEFMRIYGNYADVHFALLMLGYDIPLERMREALRDPVEGFTHALEAEVASMKDAGVEDVLDEAAVELAQTIDREERGPDGSAMFRVPADSLKVLLNIFFNHVTSGDVLVGRDYNLTDVPFEDGLEALRTWEQEFKGQRGELLDDHLIARGSVEQPGDMLRMIFTHAQFINEHMSVPRLKAVLDECTEDDLAAIRHDLDVVRGIALELKRMILFAGLHVPEGLRPIKVRAKLLTLVFAIGHWCLLADLSFRRSGYGALIERLLSIAYEPLKQAVDELEREGPTFMPLMRDELEAVFERLRRAFVEEVFLKRQVM